MALSNDVHVPCTVKMHRSLPLLKQLSLSLLLILFFLPTCGDGDVGTAARNAPPYLPTTCYGSDTSEFPSSNLFAVSGDGIWDNGAACGRQYLVRCISASIRDACSANQTIQIKIVDYINGIPSPPSAYNTTMILSSTAFGVIANLTTNSPAINIVFQHNLFAVAGDGIWDNGAACGRQYLVRCISASIRDACSQNQTIQIKIVDYINGIPSPPSAYNTTMILSSTAFGVIANLTTNSPAINIEFQRV